MRRVREGAPGGCSHTIHFPLLCRKKLSPGATDVSMLAGSRPATPPSSATQDSQAGAKDPATPCAGRDHGLLQQAHWPKSRCAGMRRGGGGGGRLLTLPREQNSLLGGLSTRRSPLPTHLVA